MISIVISLFLTLGMSQELEDLLTGATPKAQDQASLNNADLDLLAETLRSQTNSKPSSDQNAFYSHLSQRRYEEALLSMKAAFGSEVASYSANLKAVRSYLLFVNGLRVTALQDLFNISDLSQVHFYILNRWKERLPHYSDPVWVAAEFKWHPQFTKIFGTTLEARVGLTQIKLRSDIPSLKDLSLKVTDQSEEKSLINWSLALEYINQDQNKEAAAIISALLKDTKAVIPKDSIDITAARMLYQAGAYDGAISYYQKIPKSSDYWILAQEETAWAYLKKGEPQNALAKGMTITNPVFKGWAGPEAFLVTAIASLRVCDYPEVVSVLERFATVFRSRLKTLNSIAGGEVSTPAIESMKSEIRKSENKRFKLVDAGPRVHEVPNLMMSNRPLREWLKADVILEVETAKAEELFSKSMAFSGLQGEFEAIKKKLMTKKLQNLKLVENMIQTLARNEAEQIKQTLAKMHIVEAELLTHISLADRLLAGNAIKEQELVKTQVGSTGDKASYPVTYKLTEELWFDEIGRYKVDVKKACQKQRAESQ